MGTQQILLIVLSVIIVGIAVVVGIMMFNAQAYNANKQAIASENTTYGSMIVQWWKTPVSQGGAGQDETNTTVFTIPNIAAYIGFAGEDLGGNGNGLINEDTGYFCITGIDETARTVTLTAYGKEEKSGPLNPKIVTTVLLPDGTMTAQASDEANPWLAP